MSDLNEALEGLRQAKKQLQWVTFAESALKALEGAQAKTDALNAEYTRLVADREDLLKSIENAKAKFDEARRKENESAKAAEEADKKREQAEALATASLDKANAIAKKLHDEFIEALNGQLSVAQDEHASRIAALDAEIEELIQRRDAIQADIESLTKKWS